MEIAAKLAGAPDAVNARSGGHWQVSQAPGNCVTYALEEVPSGPVVKIRGNDMKVNELVAQWKANAGEQRTDESYEVRLPIYDAAKVAALCDMFPGLTRERIITDLLAAALDELASSFTYEPGDEVAAYDEMGDPMYADAGLTPRFQALAKQYAEDLKTRQDG
ncbi:hypothetical protein GCM10028792_32140 [Salinisphaera aquimarina]